MSVFRKVTRRTLAENRTRTIVTIIGILPIKSSLFSLKIKDFFDVSSINISEE